VGRSYEKGHNKHLPGLLTPSLAAEPHAWAVSVFASVLASIGILTPILLLRFIVSVGARMTNRTTGRCANLTVANQMAGDPPNDSTLDAALGRSWAGGQQQERKSHECGDGSKKIHGSHLRPPLSG
jgi:hypothetical protein